MACRLVGAKPLSANDGILLIGPLGTNFSEILLEIDPFSFKKIHLKMSPGKWRPLQWRPCLRSWAITIDDACFQLNARPCSSHCTAYDWRAQVQFMDYNDKRIALHVTEINEIFWGCSLRNWTCKLFVWQPSDRVWITLSTQWVW